MNKLEKLGIFVILLGVLGVAIYMAATNDRPIVQPIEVQEVVTIMSAEGVYIIDPPDSSYVDSLGLHILVVNAMNHFTFTRRPGDKEGNVIEIPQ